MHAITVVIPTYGRSNVLERALSSVTSQSDPPAEIIVVDDNQDEPELRLRSAAIAESFGARLVENSGPRGGSAARNAGARVAQTELLAFLDDDDWWEPTKLERQIQVLRDAGSGVGLVYTGLKVVDEEGATLRVKTAIAPSEPLRALARQNFVGTVSSVLIPKSVFIKAGGFDERLPARQDLDLWLRIAKSWKFACVEEPLTVYVNHQHGISKNFEKKLRAHEIFLEKHHTLYEADSTLLADYHYATALLCLKHGRGGFARDYLRRSLGSRVTGRALLRYLQSWMR